MRVGVVLAAAGSGRRMGSEGNKVFLPLGGQPILAHSLSCFGAIDEVEEIVIVTRDVDIELVEQIVRVAQLHKSVRIVVGGQQRQESVFLGLKAFQTNPDWIIVHDGARPYLSQELVRRGLDAVQKHKAVAVAVPVKDTIKRVTGGFVQETPERAELWAVQTPQLFAANLLYQAHAQAEKDEFVATDDCALVEKLGQAVYIVEGDYMNIKITTPEDLPTRDDFLVGFGYDVHRLVSERPLILAGVEIPFSKGLLGHSDADVVTHAVMDAILGAMGKGDIGELFPDTDEKYKGISSIILLEEVITLLTTNKLSINNLDITIMAQKPKLSPWKELMKRKLAEVCGIKEGKVNLKATTAEGLGFVGREEGIATQVVVSLRSN